MIKICRSVTAHAFDPPTPITNCHIFSDPFPLERDVLYGPPHIYTYMFVVYTGFIRNKT